MRVIEATWEKRNLGVTCAEISIDADDACEDVVAAVRARKEQYLVAKTSSENIRAVLALQQEGFSYIESMVRIEADLSKGPTIPKKCQRLVKNIGWHNASADEVEKILDIIRTGNIFSTDRISLDPYFSREIAGQRYAYWITDVLSAGSSEMLITEYLGENVGFIVYQHKETYTDPILNGLYPEFMGCGMGFVNSCCTQYYLFQKGIKRSISHISTNNSNILNMSVLFNNSFSEIRHVLIKHQ